MSSAMWRWKSPGERPRSPSARGTAALAWSHRTSTRALPAGLNTSNAGFSSAESSGTDEAGRAIGVARTIADWTGVRDAHRASWAARGGSQRDAASRWVPAIGPYVSPREWRALAPSKRDGLYFEP